MCLHKEVLVGKGKSQTVETVAACAAANAGIPMFDDTIQTRTTALPIRRTV